jgi:hypothetical protein
MKLLMPSKNHPRSQLCCTTGIATKPLMFRLMIYLSKNMETKPKKKIKDLPEFERPRGKFLISKNKRFI